MPGRGEYPAPLGVLEVSRQNGFICVGAAAAAVLTDGNIAAVVVGIVNE